VSVWPQFLLCLILIGVAGYRLSLYGDILAEKLGLSTSWVGLVLVASVTSLPELVTGVSSVTVAGVPDIAVGDVLGSCVFNLLLIVFLDFLHRRESLYTRARLGHTLSAGFGIVLIGLAAMGILASRGGMPGRIGHVGFTTPVVFLVYALAMRTVFRYEQSQPMPMEEGSARYRHLSLRHAVAGYALSAVVVVGAGLWLPFVGKAMAREMGWGEGFVGTLFVATVTSLPEAVVTVAAVRLNALDLALGNLFGSNLFNIAILGVDDLFFTRGPLLANVSLAHVISALSAMVMSGIAIIGLFYRPKGRVLRTVGWVSLLLLCVYLFNTFASYLHARPA
jgi:cation:H+ antiporter